MKKRRRAPGGGRKPSGPFYRNDAQLTLRMPSEMRARLAAAAKKRSAEKKKKVGLGQELLTRLEGSFVDDKKIRKQTLGAPRNFTLGRIIAQLAANIELITGESWRDDAFTARSLAAAIEFALSRLSPSGAVKVPPRVKQFAVPLGSQQREQYCRPEGVGFAVAAGFWQQLETLEPPREAVPNQRHAHGFYQMHWWRDALELKRRDNRRP